MVLYIANLTSNIKAVDTLLLTDKNLVGELVAWAFPKEKSRQQALDYQNIEQALVTFNIYLLVNLRVVVAKGCRMREMGKYWSKSSLSDE